MDTLDTKRKIHSCGMCGTKDGDIRPIGQIVVKLQPSIYDGKEGFLCQTCFVLNNNEVNREKNFLAAKQQLHWFQKIRKIGFSF